MKSILKFASWSALLLALIINPLAQHLTTQHDVQAPLLSDGSKIGAGTG